MALNNSNILKDANSSSLLNESAQDSNSVSFKYAESFKIKHANSEARELVKK